MAVERDPEAQLAVRDAGQPGTRRELLARRERDVALARGRERERRSVAEFRTAERNAGSVTAPET
jgi:hypothetical protein